MEGPASVTSRDVERLEMSPIRGTELLHRWRNFKPRSAMGEAKAWFSCGRGPRFERGQNSTRTPMDPLQVSAPSGRNLHLQDG
jgi:hypothetical protein